MDDKLFLNFKTEVDKRKNVLERIVTALGSKDETSSIDAKLATERELALLGLSKKDCEKNGEAILSFKSRGTKDLLPLLETLSTISGVRFDFVKEIHESKASIGSGAVSK